MFESFLSGLSDGLMVSGSIVIIGVGLFLLVAFLLVVVYACLAVNDYIDSPEKFKEAKLQKALKLEQVKALREDIQNYEGKIKAAQARIDNDYNI